MRALYPTSEIYNSVGRVQKPWIGIPLLNRGRDPPIRFRQPLDGGDGLGACKHGRKRAILAPAGRLTADSARQIEGELRVVKMPSLAIVTEPPIPGGNIAQIALVALSKAQSE